MQLIDINTWLPGDILVKADRMAMAHGLELRTPFLDREVLAVAARLARVEKTAAGTTEFALREAIGELLPQAAERAELGFPVPLATGSAAACMVSRSRWSARRRPASGWTRAPRSTSCAASGPTIPTLWRQVWLLVVFSLWHQAYMERVYDPVGRLGSEVHRR